MVRLRLKTLLIKQHIDIISIPYGTIKTYIRAVVIVGAKQFQFLMVRLRPVVGSTSARRATFQLPVKLEFTFATQLPVPDALHFNSLWYD